MFHWKHLKFFTVKFNRDVYAPRRSRKMYLNQLTQQAQTALTHAFAVTERSGNTLTTLVDAAREQGAGGNLVHQATTAIQNAQQAIQGVKAVMESPNGTTGPLGNNTAEIRELAQELLRKLG